MKKNFFIFALFFLLSLIYISCSQLEFQEVSKTPIKEGYGRVNLILNANDSSSLIQDKSVYSRTILMPDCSNSSLVITATCDGEEDVEKTFGSYETSVSLELKADKEWEIEVKRCVKNSTEDMVEIFSGKSKITVKNGETSTCSVKLNPVISDDTENTGDLYFEFNFSDSSEFYYSIECPEIVLLSSNSGDDGESNAVSIVSKTINNINAGKYRIKLGLIPKSDTISDYTSIRVYKYFDVYIYPNLTTSVWLDGNTTSTQYFFSAQNFSDNSTSVNYSLTVGGQGSGNFSFPLTVDSGTQCTLTVAQTVPGQKIEVYYGSGANIPTINPSAQPTLAGEGDSQTATLTYNFTVTQTSKLYFYVYSPDGSAIFNSETWEFTVENPYDSALSDSYSFATKLGWSTSDDFSLAEDKTGTLSLSSGDTVNIYTAQELYQLSMYVQNGKNTSGVTFNLNADVDLNEISSWTPIGTASSKAFKGSFNGNNKTIVNLAIENYTSENCGFFGYLSDGSVVKDIILKDCNISGGENTGGIAGYAKSSITNCKVCGKISGSSNVGGIAGYAISTTIDGCVNNCEISGTSPCVGGIVGETYLNNVTVKNCVNLNTVSSTSTCAGGIVGDASGGITILNCANFGNVSTTGTISCGGIGGGPSYEFTMKNCYGVGKVHVNNTDDFFALLSSSSAVVTNCYYDSNLSPHEENRTIDGTSAINFADSGYSYYDFATSLASSDTTSPYLNALTDNNYTYTKDGITYPLPVSLEGLE